MWGGLELLQLKPFWLANPVALAGLVLLGARRPRAAAACAAVSLLLAVSFLATLPGPAAGPRLGWYVWAAGFAWLAGGVVVARSLGWGRRPPHGGEAI